MPKVLADRRDQRLAGERGKAVVRHAKSEQERRGDRQAGGKRGSKGNASSSTLTTSVSIGDNENYFADSYSIAQYFDMGMVPRNEAVLDDYGWDLNHARNGARNDIGPQLQGIQSNHFRMQ